MSVKNVQYFQEKFSFKTGALASFDDFDGSASHSLKDQEIIFFTKKLKKYSNKCNNGSLKQRKSV
jgi:hypothetical protein